MGAAETQLRLGPGNLFALAKAFTDLKANANLMRLQDRITSLENAIADRREYCNASVNLNNLRTYQTADVVIAR
jgi:LemA protein